MSEHTPGPWFKNDHQLDVRPIKDGVLGDAICFLNAENPNRVSDGRLIVTAPAFEQALKDIARLTYDPMTRENKRSLENAIGQIQRIARAAIAKTEPND